MAFICPRKWTKMQELKKCLPNIFPSFNQFRPTLSLARGTNQQFYSTGVIIYNKTRHFFLFCFYSFDRQAFLGFEMTSDLHDTSMYM